VKEITKIIIFYLTTATSNSTHVRHIIHLTVNVLYSHYLEHKSSITYHF